MKRTQASKKYQGSQHKRAKIQSVVIESKSETEDSCECWQPKAGKEYYAAIPVDVTVDQLKQILVDGIVQYHSACCRNGFDACFDLFTIGQTLQFWIERDPALHLPMLQFYPDEDGDADEEFYIEVIKRSGLDDTPAYEYKLHPSWLSTKS